RVRIALCEPQEVSTLLARAVDVTVAGLKQPVRVVQRRSQGRERSSRGDSKGRRVGDAPVGSAVEIAVRAQDEAVRIHAVRAIRERGAGAEAIDRGERGADFEWRDAESAPIRRGHGYRIRAGSRWHLGIDLSIRD